MNSRWDLQSRDDDALIERLEELIRDERETLADVLSHFAEVDERRLYAERAYSSMFQYAVEYLGYAEGAARHRIRAARLARRFPAVFDLVATGAIHLAGLNVLGRHLTVANHVELLEAAAGKTRTSIEELVAARSPVTDVLSLIAPRSPVPVPMPGERRDPEMASTESPNTSRAVAPLSADSYSLMFTIDRATRERLDEARALLGQTVRDGDLGTIVSRALDALVVTLRKKKFAETDTPRSARATRSESRHIPAAVRRATSQRDRRQCTFVADDGRRCTEKTRLEFHHEKPFARGGASTADNIRLLCSTHNALLAEHDYGREHIERHRGENRGVSHELVDLARRGLCQAGFTAKIARNAVARAVTELDSEATLETLLRRSLQHTQKHASG
jgi:5-methylcytosine-specific restriction endonuclease McrA